MGRHGQGLDNVGIPVHGQADLEGEAVGQVADCNGQQVAPEGGFHGAVVSE